MESGAVFLKLSAEGLQLVKGGCFSSKYEKDQSVQYRYQIDYNRCIDNKMRYIESFREQGWEYINSTFNGWHYFRKIDDPSLPENEYEIYTDIPSRSEMAGRWLKMGYMLGIFVFLIFLLMVYRMICRPELWKLGGLAEYGIIGVMLVCGLRGMALVANGNTSDRKRKFPYHLVIVLFVAAFL